MTTAASPRPNPLRAVFTKKKMFDTTLGNALGLQVFRIVLARMLLSLRRRSCPESTLPEARHLAEEGYCVIENYLSPEQFAAVRAEFDRAREGNRFNVGAVDRENVVTDIVYLNWKDPGDYPAAVAAFRDNERFLQILKGHEGRSGGALSALGDVKSMLWCSYRVGDADGREKLEVSNCDLHADTFHTITKGFLYLDDVDEHNGSHVYVPRSHRLSLGRLLFDYRNSVGEKFGAPRISEDGVRRMGLEPRRLCYPANTLIIANEQGFHARGRFDLGRKRDLIYFEYRSQPYRNG